MRQGRGIALIIVGVALLLSLTGCAYISKSSFEKAAGLNTDRSGASNQSPVQLPRQQSRTLLQNLPDFVPVYTGVTKAYTTTSADKSTTYTYTILTDDSAQKVADWHQEQLTAKGWTVTSLVVIGDQGTVSAKRGDTADIVVSMSKDSHGAQTDISAVVNVTK